MSLSINKKYPAVFFDKQENRKAIPGLDGYEADIDGHIFSCWNTRRKTTKYRELKGCIDKDGYIMLRLSKKRCRKAHRLIAETFLPKISGKPLVCHINNNKMDNSVNNLRWDNDWGNMQDRKKAGWIGCRGDKNGNAKLTKAQVLRIRLMMELKTSQKKIASIFSVDRNTIGRIKSGFFWSHTY